MSTRRPGLPSGTVTFLFTDIEASTKLLERVGAERYATMLADHRERLRAIFERHGGVEVDTQGDAFFVAFANAPAAIQAARAVGDELAKQTVRVRVGIHTGSPLVTAEGYVGPDVHRAARIASAGHGGQVLISASTAALVPGEKLRDLGLHRLKDLSAPERLFQLGEADFPQLRSLYQTNLPVAATPFLGRAKELSELAALIGDEVIRLITLTGPGGTGKTRLAQQATAAAADAFAGGIWWIPLASLRDSRLVLPAAAQAVGAAGDLAEEIGDRDYLLLFDNFEQVIDSAADVAGLVERCPGLTIVVTSREPLRVAGEWEYPVDPMGEKDAVDLFVGRALAAGQRVSGDVTVREICRRLDNLPLAVELAAARVKILGTAPLLRRLQEHLPLPGGRLRNAPERQQTLNATIAWSHALLGSGERTLFRRLAAFRGGWTLDAAEAICDADLDTLASLVDKSLVRQRDDRFRMLETIREYAAERLADSGEDDGVRRRHAEYFLALAEEAEPYVRYDSIEWADRLELEHDNLRAALDRLQRFGETQLVLQMVGALSRFWYLKSHLVEADIWLRAALDADERQTAARARALNGAARLAFDLAEPARARPWAEEAFALHARLADAWGAAYASMMIANITALQGDLAAARLGEEEAARSFEAIGDMHYALLARENAAWMTGDLGDAKTEKALQEEIYRQARAAEQSSVASLALARLAYIAADEGRSADAQTMMRESIGIDLARGHVRMVAAGLGRLAYVVARGGQMDLATRLLASSEALTRFVGSRGPWPWHIKRNEMTRAMIQRQLELNAFERAWREGQALSFEDAVRLALGEAPEPDRLV